MAFFLLGRIRELLSMNDGVLSDCRFERVDSDNSFECSTLFAERSESVYFLREGEMTAVTVALDEHLDVEPFVPRPSVAHFVTTLYFDTPDHVLARACACERDNVKLRAREYSDQGPDLEVQSEPLVWIELKARADGQTRKQRFSVPSTKIPELLREGLSEQLQSACIAHYRRQAWQSSAGDLRVTLDTELSFHRVPTSSLGESLREVLVEPPVVAFTRSVVEIKRHGQPPAWLAALTEHALEPALVEDRPFSKFLAAMGAIHGLR
jgi:hypothetical protein